jgi:hypothetical protein
MTWFDGTLVARANAFHLWDFRYSFVAEMFSIYFCILHVVTETGFLQDFFKFFSACFFSLPPPFPGYLMVQFYDI